MITRWGVVVVTCLLAGCTGSSEGSSAAPAGSGTPVTVTTTVVASPSTVPVIGTPVASPPAPAGPPRCDAPALSVGVSGDEDAAGTKYVTIVFRNGGQQSCFLRGFPGVSAADAGGAAKVDATRDTARPAGRVVLEPGKAAHAVLAVRNVPPGSKACPTYPLVLVTPPDSRRTQRISTDVAPCADEMRISVILPGEKG